MSDSQKETYASGLRVLDQEYVKRLMVVVAGEAGLPVEFQADRIAAMGAVLAKKGVYLVQARDEDTKYRVEQHLKTKEADTVYLNAQA